MKISTVTLLSVIGTAAASGPQISVSLCRHNHFPNIILPLHRFIIPVSNDFFLPIWRVLMQVSVRDGSFDSLSGGLDPTLTWSTNGSSGDYDLEFGLEANVRATSDIASLPKSYWGKASREMGAWGVSAQADIDASNLSSADIEINAENADNDVSVKVLGSATGSSFSVSSVEGKCFVFFLV